jgi:competence protein ComEC
VAGILKTKSYTVLDEAVEGSFSIQCLRLRRVLLQRMRSYVEDELVYGVLAALVLGDTSSMQDEIQTAYANAGAVHILAVSGLHVGLIYALLAPLMKRLFSKRRARWFKTLLPMLLLWIYAGVTGLSPSVLRAAVMFSFFLIADNYAKKGNAVNTLAASALLLLVCNSALCFDVGFQLSYAAVAGIVVLQKPIERLWILPRGWQYNLWKVVAVSIAAQLATLPFTLYYFQQFPTYFLITNLLAIPISTVVLYTMLAFLLFSWYPPLAWLLANLGTSLTELMNGVVDCCAQLPGGVLRGGFIRHGEPLFFAVALFATIRWWLWVKPRALLVASISFFCISTNRLSNEYASPNKLWLFHASTKGDVVTFQNGNEVICYVDSSFMANEQERRNTVARFHFMQGFGDVRPVLMEPNDKQIPFQIPELDLVRLTPELLIDADTLPWRVIWIGSDMKSFFWKPKYLLLLENKELILSGTVSPKTVRFLGQKLSGCSELIDLRKRVFSTSK